jgi:hypothetical protein
MRPSPLASSLFALMICPTLAAAFRSSNSVR